MDGGFLAVVAITLLLIVLLTIVADRVRARLEQRELRRHRR